MYQLHRHTETGLWYWKAAGYDMLSESEFISFQGRIHTWHPEKVTFQPGVIIHFWKEGRRSLNEVTARYGKFIEVQTTSVPTEKRLANAKTDDTIVWVLNTLNPFPVTRQSLLDVEEQNKKLWQQYIENRGPLPQNANNR